MHVRAQLTRNIAIIESVDSISRDGPDIHILYVIIYYSLNFRILAPRIYYVNSIVLNLYYDKAILQQENSYYKTYVLDYALECMKKITNCACGGESLPNVWAVAS